jgi:2'-5' RNA ligase
MTTRAILIFPRFKNIGLIEDLRRDRDPLFGKVAPHVTLVFPFCCGLPADDLRAHVQAVAVHHRPFKLALQGVKASNDGYLFLAVAEGSDRIARMRDDLYSGPLAGYRDDRFEYRPHLTIGRTNELVALQVWRDQLSGFQERFETEVGEVTVERIGEGKESIIESVIRLES